MPRMIGNDSLRRLSSLLATTGPVAAVLVVVLSVCWSVALAACAASDEAAGARGESAAVAAAGETEPARDAQLATQQRQVVERLDRDAQATALDSAMAQFVSSLWNKNTESFLELFSQSEPWKYVGTITEPPQVSLVDYSQLAADLSRETGWYEALFDGRGLDCFRDHVVITDGEPWKQIGERTFIPPDAEEDSLVYVKWRRENGRWVVDEIAEPAA